MSKTTEYDRFSGLLGKIVRVPHSEIKAKLDAEKAAKRKKRKPKASASRASGVSPKEG